MSRKATSSLWCCFRNPGVTLLSSPCPPPSPCQSLRHTPSPPESISGLLTSLHLCHHCPGAVPSILAWVTGRLSHRLFSFLFFFNYFFFKINFYWSIVALQYCISLYCRALCSEINQPYMHMCPLSFGFPSRLGPCRAPSRVPCAAQSVVISLSIVFMCQCPPPSHSLPPSIFHPLVSICLFSRSVSISALQIGSSILFF